MTKFNKGDRVHPTPEAVEAGLFKKVRAGTVVTQPKEDTPGIYVRWDGLKYPMPIHPGYLTLVKETTNASSN